MCCGVIFLTAFPHTGQIVGRRWPSATRITAIMSLRNSLPSGTNLDCLGQVGKKVLDNGLIVLNNRGHRQVGYFSLLGTDPRAVHNRGTVSYKGVTI